jgi:hypothetical protein
MLENTISDSDKGIQQEIGGADVTMADNDNGNA